MNLYKLGLLGLFLGVFLSATFIPFSSDALYVGFLALDQSNPVACVLVAIGGNWGGSMFTFFCGRLAKWSWLEKRFKIKSGTLEKQKTKIDRYGVWLALISWVPFFGEAALIALGFYKTRTLPVALLLLIGISVRFIAWTLILSSTGTLL